MQYASDGAHPDRKLHRRPPADADPHSCSCPWHAPAALAAVESLHAPSNPNSNTGSDRHPHSRATRSCARSVRTRPDPGHVRDQARRGQALCPACAGRPNHIGRRRSGTGCRTKWGIYGSTMSFPNPRVAGSLGKSRICAGGKRRRSEHGQSRSDLPGPQRFPLYNRTMTDKSHHVVPDPDGGWNVLKGGSDRASKHFEIQQAAIEWARKVSRTQKTELVIHRRDGTILQKDLQGHDPLPPRDHK